MIWRINSLILDLSLSIMMGYTAETTETVAANDF